MTLIPLIDDSATNQLLFSHNHYFLQTSQKYEQNVRKNNAIVKLINTAKDMVI
jgi:hypothetical protein